MTKVQMIHQVSGSRDGVDWPLPGEFIDLPADEAEGLIKSGIVRDAKKADPPIEKAVAPKAETRRGLTKKSLSGE